MKKNDKKPEPAYKTEDQLKAEAKAQLELDRKIAAARKPPTQIERAEKKVDNFFYHYKGLTMGVAVAVVLIAFFIHDMLDRQNPDITVLFVSERYFNTDTVTALEEALTPYATDLNGDGKVTVVVDHLTVSRTEQEQNSDDSQPAGTGTMDAEMQYANVMKLVAVLSTNSDPILLMDKPNYNFIATSDASEDGVMPEPGSVFYLLDSTAGAQGEALPFSSTKLSGEISATGLDELSFYCRTPRENTKEKNLRYFEQCREIVESLAK